MKPFNQLFLPNKVEVYLNIYDELDFKVEEYLSFLLEADKLKLKSIHSPSRIREFLLVRKLLNTHLPTERIRYSTIGAPEIESGYISISHSKDSVVLAFNPTNIIGVDIETKGSRAFQVKSKFISVHEEELFGSIDANLSTILWCAKECMYKMGLSKSIDFKKDILIKPTATQNMLEGRIHTQQGILTSTLHVNHLKDHILVVGIVDNKKIVS